MAKCKKKYKKNPELGLVHFKKNKARMHMETWSMTCLYFADVHQVLVNEADLSVTA